MRAAAILWAASIDGLQVYIFRRIYNDLIKNHMEGPKGFRSLLAPWVANGWCQIVEDEIRFHNGSKIFLCHCEHEKHVYKYQGSEIHVLLIDELTHFTETMYRFLRGRVRMAGIDVPEQYKGRFPRILVSANPGNIGHLWVKQTFIDDAVPYARRRMDAKSGGLLRQFIPALLDDNPSILEDDPTYESRLEGLGSANLVKAMRFGEWNVVEGAFFDCWSPQLVIPPFTIPAEWARFRSMDWGSNSPFSIGWWAVVQDDYDLEVRHADAESGHPGGRRVLPRGSLVRYRELYGQRGGKLTAEQVADRIIELEHERLEYGVLDPSAFKEDGGPSIAERINLKLLGHRPRLAPFRKADNARVSVRMSRDRSGPMGGWDQMRGRMIGKNNVPYIYCFETCLNSIRTIPVLQHDPIKAEDLDTKGEDHAADEWRYACMSRPWLKPAPEKEEVKDGYQLPYQEIEEHSASIKLL